MRQQRRAGWRGEKRIERREEGERGREEGTGKIGEGKERKREERNGSTLSVVRITLACAPMCGAIGAPVPWTMPKPVNSHLPLKYVGV